VKRLGAFVVALGASLTWATGALAEPVRILVAAGHRVGLAAESPLKYADSDAARVREVLVGFGGVRPEHAIVLSEPTRAQLFAAFDRAREVARGHRADEVTLVFYYSGHGDREALHLGDERVLISDVTSKLAEVPAGLRIAVTDACRTNREKGFVVDEPFAIAATHGPEASGQVWLHASREGETAQESDDLGGAIFTHAWLNGLRGAADTNGDSRVTLDESFAFAHAQTLIRSAKSSGVLQKPEAIVNLRELAPVVLTQTAANMAKVSLPAARDTHFLIYAAGAKTVFAELWGAPDRRTGLALPPGRYMIQRRVGGGGAAAQLALAAGEDRRLEERDFAYSSLAAVAQKGDSIDPDRVEPQAPKRLPPHEVAALYEIGSDTRTGLVHSAVASYAYAWPRVAISAGAGADLTQRSVQATEEHLTTAYGRAGIEIRVPIESFALHFAAGGRAGWMWQTLRPEASSTPVSTVAPAAAPADHGAFVAGPDAKAFLRSPLGTTFFVDVGADARVMFVREEDRTHGIPSVSALVGLGGRP
jgi:hypothetical protein